MSDSSEPAVPKLDVVTIGHALVDVFAPTTDKFLDSHGLTPGSMNLIDDKRAEELYAEMGTGTESSGGSAANTATGVAACGGRAAFIGTVANDELGQIFAHDMRAAGVVYRTPPTATPPATGRSMILVSDDGERTMNTYLGASALIKIPHLDRELLETAMITYVEGYIMDTPDSSDALHHAASYVHQAGHKFSVTLSDMFCVERHRDKFMDLLDGSIDIVFGNDEEARGLLQLDDLDAALNELAKRCEVVAITRGAKGSVLIRDGQRIDIEATPVNVVDTTGAGDLYAAGVLTGLAAGYDLERCGQMGSRAAAAIITQVGARLSKSL